MFRSLAVLVAVSLVLSGAKNASAFAYIFAGETNGLDVVSHPQGYVGTGGTLVVTLGINPGTTNASQMVVSAQNVVRTINYKAATTGNLEFVSLSGQVDFESTLLHEVGHSLGLAHVNAATESQLPSSQRNYTKATNGANNNFDLNAGADGVIGSADDIRGDDDNLNWFKPPTITPSLWQVLLIQRRIAETLSIFLRVTCSRPMVTERLPISCFHWRIPKL